MTDPWGKSVATVDRPGRSQYLFAIGIVVGLLVAGLVVPFIGGNTRIVRASSGADSGGITDEQSGSALGSGGDAAAAAGSAAGPSGSSASPGAAARAATAPGARGAALPASSPGVSSGEIKLGIALLDLKVVRQIGLGAALTGTTPAQQQVDWQFFIDEVNRAGGILGRKIVPSFTTFDPTDSTSGRKACLALTEDAKVFAAIISPGLFGDPILCFTEEHGVPTLEYSVEADAWYRRSKGLLFTPGMTGSRGLRSLVTRLATDGSLKGKKIGVVSTDAPTEKLPVDEGLLPALKDAGYSVAARSTITQNIDQQPSQIPVEISRMRSAGVDYIMWVSNALVFAQWTQTAANQGYNPPYALTDINSGSNDFTVQNVPASTKAIAVTAIRDGEQHANMSEDPTSQACRERFERATGSKLTRGSSDYQTVLEACGFVHAFATAAQRAGANLTSQTFSQAMQTLGRFEFAYFAPGTFAPGKFDMADYVRTKTFQSGCKCWVPQGDFQPGAPHS